MAKGPDACFKRESLLEAYNLTSKFDFTSALQANLDKASSSDVTGAFAGATKGIYDMAAEIDGLQRASFGYPPSAITDWLDAVNARTSQPAGCAAAKTAAFTVANINQPYDDQGDSKPVAADDTASGAAYLAGAFSAANGCDAAVTGGWVSAWQQLAAIETAFVDVDTFVASMKKDMGKAADTLAAPPQTTCYAGCASADCQAPAAPAAGGGTPQCAADYKFTDSAVLATKKLTADTEKLNKDVKALGQSVVGDAITSIDDFKCEAFCDFVPNGYVRVVQGDMCSTTLGGVFRIMVAFLALSVCTLLLVVFSVVLNKRLAAPIPPIPREKDTHHHSWRMPVQAPKFGRQQKKGGVGGTPSAGGIAMGGHPMPSSAVALPGMHGNGGKVMTYGQPAGGAIV